MSSHNDINPLRHMHTIYIKKQPTQTGTQLGKYIAKTGFEDVPTETLRNLWLTKFGGRAVTLNDMYELRGTDIVEIGQELANRNLIRYERWNNPGLFEATHEYILEKDDADN